MIGHRLFNNTYTLTGKLYAMAMRNRFLSLLLLLVASSNSYASVTISGTRIIYPAQEREVTIDLTNKNETPALIQSWIGSGDPKIGPGEERLPFIVTPPLTRIESKQGQSLRITYTGEPLPKDVESVFWFNMLEVPPTGKDAKGKNFIQLAYRSQLKFFFRPVGMQGDPKAAGMSVHWSIVNSENGYALRGTNDSPFHISVAGATLKTNGEDYVNVGGGMIEPLSHFDYQLKGLHGTVTTADVSYQWINDLGSVETTESELSAN